MKFNLATTVFAVVLTFAVGGNAISCQDEANGIRTARCEWDSCPVGYRSVFWDTGCTDGQKCCI
ncbi:hypothetical protein P691DRAFT_806986 [Macrolepiota fuliginosa MF-IS2]|uniref:Uncharacterized protein n=1 Tax=Macrolepiota fuliginosa MF-IS2 TaxID=1400762 RepID=A0A9P5X7B2_9AGAR|nr:hypothetical protein P691DRAFT_806986 [Macrolepiota fuliginosa MF-IS2]